MRFINWFTRKAPRHLGTVGLSKVPKWCHPGKKGKIIVCPSCSNHSRAYNFSWAKMTCVYCRTDHLKHDWFLLDKPK